MTILDEIVRLYSDENNLKALAISSEYFAFLNILSILENRSQMETKVYLSQLEVNITYFYERIKNDLVLKQYSIKIKNILQETVSEDTIPLLQILFDEIGKKLQLRNAVNDIIVKELL